MKTIRLIVSIVLIGCVAIGWLTFTSSSVKDVVERASYAKEGASYYDEGLYQKSIEAYKQAQEMKYSVKTEEALLKSLEAAYRDETGSASDYTDEYLKLCRSNPSNSEYWKELLSFCLAEEDYNTGILVCKAIKKLKVNDPSLFELTDKFNYFYSEKNKIYNTMIGGSTGYYTAYDGNRWCVVTPDNGKLYEEVGPYLGGISANNDYIVVYEKDARLIDKKGVVQAILKNHTDNMRAYGDGMIPMQQKDGTWSYYDIKEKKYTLTGYENASSFQNKTAFVKEKEGWKLIGLDGNTKKETVFSDVRLYDNGEYMKDGVFVAAVDGMYNLYKADGTKETSIDAKAMDRYFGSAIAYCDSNDKWGFMNEQGKTIIEPQYKEASSFSHGVAGVSNGEKWAFINEDGRIVSEYKFLYIGYNSSENYCPVGDMNNEYYTVYFNFLNNH